MRQLTYDNNKDFVNYIVITFKNQIKNSDKCGIKIFISLFELIRFVICKFVAGN